jgi:cathepsin L
VPNAQDIDWRAKGAVGPVKNQGQCAAAYTFSATGSLEGLSKVADGILKSFSEQQIIDCSRPYGSQGCAGGWATNAFKFVKDHGICTTD